MEAESRIWTQVESSNLKAVSYDAENRELYVWFLGGGIYVYYDVPPERYAGLIEAPSHGSYFVEHIRNTYRYRKIA